MKIVRDRPVMTVQSKLHRHRHLCRWSNAKHTPKTASGEKLLCGIHRGFGEETLTDSDVSWSDFPGNMR